MTYTLCVQISGSSCLVPWTDTTKIYIDNLSVKILREPFSKVELYLLVNYPLGQTYAARKLEIAVCGSETVQGSVTQLAEFKYEYEVGSSIDGGAGSYRWVIWSEEFEPYFQSTDSNCPIYQYEIYASIFPESGINV